MKQFVSIFLFFTITIVCMAQEEIIFNNQNVYKKDIKVNRTIQGIEFGTNLIRILPGKYMGYKFGSIETYLNYFHENRIANAWTLNKSIGIGNSFYHTLTYENIKTVSEGYGSATEVDQYVYDLSLQLKLEPRWYFDQRQRYRGNKSTRNNTGWFFSLPFMFSTNLLQQPVVGSTSEWFPERFVLNIMAPPTIGYRNSFTKNLFIEVSAGYIPLHSSFYNGTFYMKSASKIGLLSADSFNSELKIAYTF